MLTMTTAVRPGSWFEYDSEGSFALGCLVEKISSKQLVDEKYMTDAVSSLSRPDISNDINHKYAYGYQI